MGGCMRNQNLSKEDLRQMLIFESSPQGKLISQTHLSKTTRARFDHQELPIHAVRHMFTLPWDHIQRLHIYDNKLGNSGVTLLTSRNWPNLMGLDIENNNLTKLIINCQHLPKLIRLWLGNNLGYGNRNLLDQLPENITQLNQLQILSLHDEQFKTIPQHLILLRKLNRLYIYGNMIPQIQSDPTFRALQTKKVQFFGGYQQK